MANFGDAASSAKQYYSPLFKAGLLGGQMPKGQRDSKLTSRIFSKASIF